MSDGHIMPPEFGAAAVQRLAASEGERVLCANGQRVCQLDFTPTNVSET